MALTLVIPNSVNNQNNQFIIIIIMIICHYQIMHRSY